jgi:hypothetical protein
MKLEGQPAEVYITLQITRKATGQTETVHLVGRTTVEEAQAAGIQQKEPHDGDDSQHGGA